MRTRGVLRRSLRLWRTRIGLAITLALVLVAIFGPFFAPHDPSALLGRPYQVPSPGLPLGADYLGQDVLSRFLDGGRSILLVAAISTALGVGGGVAHRAVGGAVQRLGRQRAAARSPTSCWRSRRSCWR